MVIVGSNEFGGRRSKSREVRVQAFPATPLQRTEHDDRTRRPLDDVLDATAEEGTTRDRPHVRTREDGVDGVSTVAASSRTGRGGRRDRHFPFCIERYRVPSSVSRREGAGCGFLLAGRIADVALRSRLIWRCGSLSRSTASGRRRPSAATAGGETEATERGLAERIGNVRGRVPTGSRRTCRQNTDKIKVECLRSVENRSEIGHHDREAGTDDEIGCFTTSSWRQRDYQNW